jgi:hypothetical protein
LGQGGEGFDYRQRFHISKSIEVYYICQFMREKRDSVGRSLAEVEKVVRSKDGQATVQPGCSHKDTREHRSLAIPSAQGHLLAPNVPLTFADTASRNGRPTRSGCSC